MDLLLTVMTLSVALLAAWLVCDELRDHGLVGADSDSVLTVQPDAGLVERLRRGRSAA